MRVLRRRGWVVLAAVALITTAAAVQSARQDELYRSSADVLLRPQSFSPGLVSEVPDVFATSSAQADRYVNTQVRIARLPLVAERVLRTAGVSSMTPREFLNRSQVTADRNADVLQFSVTIDDRELAPRLATEYGRAYTAYRSELDTGALDRALVALRAQLALYDRPDERATPVYATLVERVQQLTTARKLSEENAFLVRPADSVAQVQPRTARNAVLAGVLALFLGLGLALIWEALDTRVRTADTVAGALGLPMLARLAGPPRRLRRTNELVMLADPYGPEAESFRLLRTNLEFANAERGARTILLTSAGEEEGKTTTIANLAVAFARAGRRVVLVDLDLRRPLVHRFFGIEDRPGITDVVFGRAALADARTRVTIPASDAAPAGGPGSPNGNGPVEGFLDVIPSGASPLDPGEFAGSRALTELLDQLAADADVVLVDAPPVLRVVDAPALSSSVDALLLVVRMNVVRAPMLRELRRILDHLPVAKLGFVVTGAEAEEGSGYEYTRYERAPRVQTVRERARAAISRGAGE